MFQSGTMRSCHVDALRNQGQRLLRATVFAGLVSIFASSASAQERFQIGGSEIAITASNGFQQLRFKNQSIAEGEAIRPLAQFDDRGSQALVFTVKAGGGACKGGVLVLTAQPGEEPRFDRRLIDECGGFELARTETSAFLISSASPGASGVLWRVSAKAGLRQEATLVFAPEPGTDFTDLKPAMDAQALLRNQAVWTAFTTLTGTESRRYAALLMAAGPSIETTPPLIAAVGCGGDCRNGGALMIIDPSKRAVYLACRNKGQKRLIKPDEVRWPAEARVLLGRWAQSSP